LRHHIDNDNRCFKEKNKKGKKKKKGKEKEGRARKMILE
jgi:hypothetical protein